VICDGCHWLRKKDEVDSEGCIHISWFCEKRKINIYYQIIRSDRFLERNVGYERIEVLQRPNIDKCSVRMPVTAKLTNYTKQEKSI